MYQKVAEYLIDVSKLILAGVVITTITGIQNISKLFVLVLGIVATLSFAMIGFVMLYKEEH